MTASTAVGNVGIGSWIERRARTAPDGVALIAGHCSWTYPELADRVRRLANGLRTLGVAKGDRVAWLGPNHPAFLESLFAAGLLGAAMAPVNHRGPLRTGLTYFGEIDSAQSISPVGRGSRCQRTLISRPGLCQQCRHPDCGVSRPASRNVRVSVATEIGSGTHFVMRVLLVLPMRRAFRAGPDHDASCEPKRRHVLLPHLAGVVVERIAAVALIEVRARAPGAPRGVRTAGRVRSGALPLPAVAGRCRDRWSAGADPATGAAFQVSTIGVRAQDVRRADRWADGALRAT